MRYFIDTNILIYAVNKTCREHTICKTFLEKLLASAESWCTSWGVVYEFLRVVTHPRVFERPLSTKEALNFLSVLLASNALVILKAGEQHLDFLSKVCNELGSPSGNLFHDIQTAVLMREHGVREIVSNDTDFLQFDSIKVLNPLR